MSEPPLADQNLRRDILRYLHAIDGVQDGEIDRIIEECILEVKELSRFHSLIDYSDIQIDHKKSTITFSQFALTLQSADLLQLLQYSTKAGFFAATLGYQIDQRIKYYNTADLTRAVIFDACASAYIEHRSDEVQHLAESPFTETGLVFTFRYSPGYGDLGLEHQEQILSVLNATKLIGLSTTSYHTLIPRKSITGIFGIEKQEQANLKSSDIVLPNTHPCKNCKNYNHCIYLKEGTYCEYRKRNL